MGINININQIIKLYGHRIKDITKSNGKSN